MRFRSSGGAAELFVLLPGRTTRRQVSRTFEGSTEHEMAREARVAREATRERLEKNGSYRRVIETSLTVIARNSGLFNSRL